MLREELLHTRGELRLYSLLHLRLLKSAENPARPPAAEAPAAAAAEKPAKAPAEAVLLRLLLRMRLSLVMHFASVSE